MIYCKGKNNETMLTTCSRYRHGYYRPLAQVIHAADWQNLHDSNVICPGASCSLDFTFYQWM